MTNSSLTALAAVALFTLAGCAHKPIFENIHTVVPNGVYRSAQLSPQRLEQLIERQKIKSVLNLRGAHPGEPWYDGEIAVANKHKVAHYNLTLDSRSEPTPAQTADLLAIMKAAPKPMVIHCWAGADRTGLASALYLYEIEGKDPRQAAKALSVRYYHLSQFSAGAMDRHFDKYVTAKIAAARQPKPKGPVETASEIAVVTAESGDPQAGVPAMQ